MERLDDILDSDLDYIFTQYRDLTIPTMLQVGSEKFNILASLQSSDIEFSSSERPVNAYKLELLIRSKDISPTAKKKISKDAIIYIDGTAYKVVDADISRGVIAMNLERGTTRGTGLSGREL